MGLSLSRAWDNVTDAISSIGSALGSIFEPIAEVLGFEGKTVTQGVVQSIRIYPNNLNEGDFVKETVLKAVLNNRDLPPDLAYLHFTGYIRDAVKYHNYGFNDYIHGLPQIGFNYYNLDNSDVRNVLDVIKGEPTEIMLAIIQEPTVHERAKSWLIDNESNYDYLTDQLDDGTDIWTYSSAQYNGDFSIITIEFDHTSGPSTDPTYTIQMPSTNPSNGSWYYVEYELVSSPGDRYIWVYDINTGVYPSLSETTSEVLGMGLYPVVPLRTNKVNINSNKESAEYLSCKKILNYVKMDIDNLVTGVIEDGDGNPTPDLDKIQDAYVLFGLSIYTESQAGKAYLYEFFLSLSAYADNSVEWASSAPIYQTEGDGENPPESYEGRRSQFVFDANEGRYNTALSMNYIDVSIVSGVIGSVGDYETIIQYNENFVTGGSGFVNRGKSQTYAASTLTIQKQINATQYRQIRVHGLLAATGILDGNNATQVINQIPENGTNDNLIIPLSIAVLDELPAMAINTVWHESAHIVVYAAESEYLEWYQTPEFLGLFVFVIQVVGLILALPTKGTSSAYAAAIAKYLLYRYAFEFVIQKLLERFGDDEDAAALIVIASIYLAAEFGADFFELSGEDLFFEVTNSAIKTINTYSDIQLRELELEQDAFLKSLEEAQEEIDNAAELLDSSKLDPLFVTETRLLRNETTEQFLQRTLMSGGDYIRTVFEQIPLYVDNSLNLEKLKTRYETQTGRYI